MPSIKSRIAELRNKFYKFAPKQSQEKIEKVLEIYKDRANLNFRTVQNMVMALYSPSLIGKDKVEKMYGNFLDKYQNEEKYPTDLRREMTNKEKLEERRDRLLGVKRSYQLSVILYTQEKKLDPKKKDEYVSTQEKLPAKIKRTRGLVQITRMHITVQAYNSKLFEALKWRLSLRGTKEFRQLYPICMTDKALAVRDRNIPGYIDGVYLIDWTAIGQHGKYWKDPEPVGKNPKKAVKRKATTEERRAVRNPMLTRKRAGGDKVAIAFKYCSCQIDSTKQSF